METRNKLRRGKSNSTYIVGAVVTIIIAFLLVCYVTYELMCYGSDNNLPIQELYSIDTIMNATNYFTNPRTSLDIGFVWIEVAQIATVKAWWIYLTIPVIFFVMATSGNDNEYRGIEKGGAKWEEEATKKLFSDDTGIPMGNNFYVTVTNPQKKFYSTDNLNEIVIGGSGASKTYRKVKPDIVQMIGSYVSTDPKGELYRDTAKILKMNGYKIKVLNLDDINQTNSYNPFVYMEDQSDVLDIADLFMKNTAGDNDKEDFWTNSAKDLLIAVMMYLFKSDTEVKSFGRVLRLVNSISYKDGKIDPDCELSLCMEIHKINNPLDAGTVNWNGCKSTPETTMGGIAKTLSTRLGSWAIEEIDSMTATDEMDLDMVGVEKTAIFVIIKPARNPYKALINIFYSQLFERLMRTAKKKYNGRLPLLVSCELDEFANVGQIPSFSETLSVVRSFNIRICIVLQGLSQLKALYEKTYENIISNCSLFTYLGTNDMETKKYIVEKIGKTTVRSESKSWNQSSTGGSSSKSEHYDSRDLVDVAELPLIIKKNKRYGGSCILFIDRYRPFFSPKFNSPKHPLFSLTGSTFPSGIKNITKLEEEFKERVLAKAQEKEATIRKFLEDEKQKEENENLEQERLFLEYTEKFKDVDLSDLEEIELSDEDIPNFEIKTSTPITAKSAENGDENPFGDDDLSTDDDDENEEGDDENEWKNADAGEFA